MQISQNKNDQEQLSSFTVPALKIDRTFSVPVEQLFAAFTTSEAIKAWWWPNGLFTDHVDLDFREGGKYIINMKGHAPVGGAGMTGEILEINPNKRIVMSDSFSDGEGNAISAKQANMPGEWPSEITIAFDFTSEGDSSSSLHLTQNGIPREAQKDCIQGWNESFMKLEKYLG